MKINTKIMLGIFALILSMLSFTIAGECVGQGCNANFSLNVTNYTQITPILPRYSVTGQAIYDVLTSSGAGLGTFFTFLGQSFPILIIILVLIALLVAVVYTILKSVHLWKEARDV